MDGPRLAGLLTAIVVSSFALGCLFLWAVYYRRRNLDQDLEELDTTRAAILSHQLSTFRLLDEPPKDYDIYLAMTTLRQILRNLVGYCVEKSEPASQPMSESQLQSCLTELSGAEHRISSRRLLELIPSRASVFVSHVVGTALIGAITDHVKRPTTILPSALAPAVTARPSIEDSNGQDRRCIIALTRHCVSTLYPAEPDQDGIDRLTRLLTNLLGDALGSSVIRDDDELGPKLHAAVVAAIYLGSCLVHHPADFRFDWTVDNQSIETPVGEKPVTVFPWLYRESDIRGVPEFPPVLIECGAVDRVTERGSRGWGRLVPRSEGL